MRAWLGLAVLMASIASVCAGDVPRSLTLTVGKGDLIQFTNDVQRVAVAEPKVADAIVVSPHEVMVNAKGVGWTTLIVWEAGAQPARYDIRVNSDTFEMDSLRDEMHKMAGPDVWVTGSDQGLVLTGKAASTDVSKRAAALAGTHAKNVVNLLQTPPAQEPRQILLEVKFASIDRTRLSEFGFNLFSTNGKGFGTATTEQFQQPRFTQLTGSNGNTQTPSVNFADLLNLFYYNPALNLGATINDLLQQNLMQVLAEPNMIVLEGKTGSFLAGGQFPFPTITSTTTGGAISPVITVQFKPYGVKLDFTPTITAQGAIDLQVDPEVSSLDYTNAVQLQGFLIPALTTRRAETEVVLKDGDTFAIAGLMDNRVTKEQSKIKGLGDIPILGQLFRSSAVTKTNTELVVMITAHLVHPMGPGEKPKLPPVIEPYLPTAAQQKAALDAKKKKKKKTADDPQYVGPSGHQNPTTTP